MSKSFFNLAGGNFFQDWSNSGLITINNNWDSVPSIVGYLGDDASTSTAARDPRLITSDASLGAVNVLHDIAVTSTTGGVGEFSALTDPTIGLQGSGTADEPSIVLYLNSDGRQNLHLDVDVRHIDTDNTPQQFDIQYRLGDTGAFTNLPGGYLSGTASDGSAIPTGGSLHLSIDLPDALAGQDQVELRFMTTNAASNDEWLGVDNISVTSSAAPPDIVSPTLVSTVPATGSGHLAAPDANLTMTFSEAVKAGAGSFTITGDAGDVHTISAADATQVTFSGSTVVINPTSDLNPSEQYHLAISSTAVTDRAGNAFAGASDAADFTTANPTPRIFDIQGAGQTSAYTGLHVTTTGVVTATDTTGSLGFWMQDQTGDGNDATSDAVFVFTGTAPTAHVGDLVQVSGTVQEFQGSDANNLSITEVSTSNANVTVEGTGFTVAPTIIGDGGRHAPTEVIDSDHFQAFNPDHDAVDFYESMEGMLVTIKNTVAVDSTFSGETFVVPDNGVGVTGFNDREGVTIGPNDMNPERIELFNDSGVSPITLNNVTGDHLGDVTGVVSYFGGNYEVLPISVGSTATAGAVVRETTTLTGDAQHLTVGEYNLENIDPTDPQAKFDALASDIVHNLGAPDIMGLEEIQDADGAGNGSDLSGTATLTKLVNAIAAAGGPHYAFAEIAPTVNNANGGEPGGNIRQAFLYDPTKVSLVDGSLRQINDDNLTDGDTYNNSRHPLVGDFTFNGETVTVVDAHNFARSGSDELFGLDQPPINAGDQRRIDQTTPIEHFVQQQEATDPNAHIIVTGDFNGFQFETAQTQLETGGILTNLDTQLDPTDRYSFSFDGNMEQIDQMYASPGLVAGGGAQFDIVHLNTGAPDSRPTDHDPTLGRFLINAAPTAVNDIASVAEKQSVTIDVLANDTDPNPNDTKTIASVGDTALGGHVSIVNGQLVYSADADAFDLLNQGQNVTDTFSYVMHDAAGATSTATVSVTVNGVANAPTQNGGNGNSTLTGTAGDEVLNGGNGNDSVAAGGGTDTLSGANGNDSLQGGAGIDHLDGGNGNDSMDGGAGNDSLSGGNGNDTLTGGGGDDVMTGGNGPDRFIFHAGFGHDTVTDFDHTDQLQFDHALFADFDSLMQQAHQVGADVVIQFDAADAVTLTGVQLTSLHASEFVFV